MCFLSHGRLVMSANQVISAMKLNRRPVEQLLRSSPVFTSKDENCETALKPRAGADS